MKVIGCNPRGYCLGVIKAIELVLSLRKDNPNKEVFVYGRLVHNDDVIAMLLENNIKTLDYSTNPTSLFNSLPKNSILVFTAHGHDSKLDLIAKEAGLECFDATCSRVKDNMDLLRKESNAGRESIYIGKKNHPETVAALSISPLIKLYDISERLDFNLINIDNPIVINQTTLSFLDLEKEHNLIKRKLPNAQIINEICNATLLRQNAVINLPDEVDFIYVVGDKNSSNTNKLFEIGCSKVGINNVRRILNKSEINKNDLKGHNCIAVCSGASTPLEITNSVIEEIKSI